MDASGYRAATPIQNGLSSEEGTSLLSDSESENTVARTLSIEPSVYDEALVVPLLSKKDSQDVFLRRQTSWCMLFMNVVMQAIILLKIMELVWVKHSVTTAAMWGEQGGACDRVEEADVPILNLSTRPVAGAAYLNCVPESLMLASNFAKLDLDQNGMFTRAEAKNVSAAWRARMPHRAILVDDLFDNIVDSSEDKQIDVTQYKINGFPQASWAQEQKVLNLCQALMPTVCPNLEMRGILARYISNANPERRISRCEYLLEYVCPDLVGEKYKQFQIYHEDLCGDAITMWHGAAKLRTVKFSSEIKFVNGWDGVSGPIYCGFLVVLLSIWWFSMLAEFRGVHEWWCFLWYFPTTTSNDPHQWTQEAQGGIQIVKLPTLHRIGCIAFNLVPRTILVVLCSGIGSVFLTMADDYEDLILNCVALSFLIEIDEMIFTGLVSDKRQRWVGDCDAMEFEMPSKFVSKSFPWTVFHLCCVLAIVSFIVAVSYTMPTGKYAAARALECLCVSEGDFCVTAQILGGFPSVAAALPTALAR